MTKLASNPGHAVTFTRGNKKTGRPEKPILPTPHEVAILRRAAAGYVKCTLTEDGPQYSYEDGTPLLLRWSRRDPTGASHFAKLVTSGWLIPDKLDSLIVDGPPQIYRARKP